MQRRQKLCLVIGDGTQVRSNVRGWFFNKGIGSLGGDNGKTSSGRRWVKSSFGTMCSASTRPWKEFSQNCLLHSIVRRPCTKKLAQGLFQGEILTIGHNGMVNFRVKLLDQKTFMVKYYNIPCGLPLRQISSKVLIQNLLLLIYTFNFG